MGNQKALHTAAAHCEALFTGLGRDKRCPQRDHERVDHDPLLTVLEDIAQQGTLDCLELADRTSQCRLLLWPKDLVQVINFADPCNAHFERLAALTRSSEHGGTVIDHGNPFIAKRRASLK